MKKNNKRTKKGAIIALCMAGAIAISGAFAFLSDSDTAINRFKFTDDDGEQTVDVEIQEPHWSVDAGDNVLPLETVTKDPKVVNLGENDIYSYVTVLVPTAKSIQLNDDNGGVYTASNVELFRYTVNSDWKEIDLTNHVKDIDETGKQRFVSKALDKNVTDAATGETEKVERTLVFNDAGAVTNKDASNSNVYYTAHTYAYAPDGVLAKVTDETSSVFNSVTMINIADGAKVSVLDGMSDEEIDAYMTALVGKIETTDDVAYDSTEKEITVTKGESSVVAFKVVEEDGVKYLLNSNNDKQTKTMSQLLKDDKIDVIITTNAIQADNIPTTDINAGWTLVANVAAGVAEGTNYNPQSFYFDKI